MLSTTKPFSFLKEEKTRVKWIFHNKKKIIFIDYNHLSSVNEDEALRIQDEVHQFVMNAGKDLRILCDVTNAHSSSALQKKMKEHLNAEKPIILKEAVLGITGAKLILLKGVNLFANIGIKSFDDKTKALDWLAE